MINDNDMYFHTPTSDHYSWAETNYFGFYIPEENILVGVYAQPRANLGTAPRQSGLSAVEHTYNKRLL